MFNAFVCTCRVALWTVTQMLSPRVVPRGSWTPRSPSARSALSTRPPYFEWTLLPDLSTRAWSHSSSLPSFCVPFTLTHFLGRTVLPCLPSDITCVLTTTQPATVNKVFILYSQSPHLQPSSCWYHSLPACHSSSLLISFPFTLFAS